MDKAITKYLVDIKQAIADIEYFTTQRPRQYTVFCEDLMFRSAIERKIGIIGEAMTKILQIEPSIPITNARKIKGTRNYIVHAYDSLSPEMLWGIVINDLDTLKKEVMNLLTPTNLK